MAVNPKPEHNPVEHDDSARSRLLEAALSLFAAKGYPGTSVREIIEKAGVTRPVLYYYFKNKEDLFCTLVETHFAQFYRDIDSIRRDHAHCRERLEALILNSFDTAEDSPEIVRFLLRYFFAPPDQSMRLDSEHLAEQRFARIVAIMQDALDSGEIHGGDAASLALAFSGFMDLHVMAKARRPEAHLTRALGEALVELFLQGADSSERSRGQLYYAFEDASTASGTNPNKAEPS